MFCVGAAVVHNLPSLFISLCLNEMLGDIKVMLQAYKLFKAPWVSVQGGRKSGVKTQGALQRRKWQIVTILLSLFVNHVVYYYTILTKPTLNMICYRQKINLTIAAAWLHNGFLL